MKELTAEGAEPHVGNPWELLIGLKDCYQTVSTVGSGSWPDPPSVLNNPFSESTPYRGHSYFAKYGDISTLR